VKGLTNCSRDQPRLARSARQPKSQIVGQTGGVHIHLFWLTLKRTETLCLAQLGHVPEMPAAQGFPAQSRQGAGVPLVRPFHQGRICGEVKPNRAPHGARTGEPNGQGEPRGVSCQVTLGHGA